MFNNIGKRLKEIAIVVALLDIVGTIVLAVSAYDIYYSGTAVIIVLLLGALSTILTTFSLYGFGQLVDDVHQIKEQSKGASVDTDELPDL